MNPVKLITKTNKTTNAYKKLKDALLFEYVSVEKRGKGFTDYHTLFSLVASGYLVAGDFGPRGGTHYKITEEGRAAFIAATTQINS
jgi:hypothetical protein